jgi:hypothetical protein
MDDASKKSVPRATVDQILRDYNSYLPRFVKPGKAKPRHEWCRVALRTRAEAHQDLLRLHQTYYPMVSSIHHGDAQGLFAQSDSAGRVDMPPSWSHLDTALVSGLGSFLRCLDYFDTIASLGFRDRLETVLADYVDSVREAASTSSA